MPLFVFNYEKCIETHPFMPLGFAGVCSAILSGIAIVLIIAGAVVMNIKNKDI